MGELLLSLEVVIMLLLLHDSLLALLRSREEDCEQAVSCHKLPPASFPPYCNIDSFKQLSEKVHVSVHFPHLINPHTERERHLNHIDFMRLHQTNHSFSPFLFAHVGNIKTALHFTLDKKGTVRPEATT